MFQIHLRFLENYTKYVLVMACIYLRKLIVQLKEFCELLPFHELVLLYSLLDQVI